MSQPLAETPRRREEDNLLLTVSPQHILLSDVNTTAAHHNTGFWAFPPLPKNDEEK
jgi:hypothetical protein